MNMDATTRNLLAIVLTKGLKADAVPPGDYELRGRLVVDVDVVVKKGDKQTYKPTVHIPLKSVLAIALVKAGVAALDIALIVSEAAKEALTNGKAVEEALEATEAGLAAVEKLLDRLPPQTREGATKVVGDVDVVAFEEVTLPALVSA